MKTPVGRVLVLGKALRDTWERPTCWYWPGRRNGADYGEPGTAMRTVGEGITKTAVLPGHPPPADRHRARRHRQPRWSASPGHTGAYLESIGYPSDNHRTAFDASIRASGGHSRCSEPIKASSCRAPPDPDTHAKRIVPDRPRKLMHGQAARLWAETDALHRAFDTGWFPRRCIQKHCPLIPGFCATSMAISRQTEPAVPIRPSSR